MRTRDKVFLFIKNHIAEKGYPPTIREIGNAVGLQSTSTVHGHVSNLVAEGKLTRQEASPRALRDPIEGVGGVTVLLRGDDCPTMIEWGGHKYKLIE